MNSDKEQEKVNESKVVIYEDVSMERGAFLIQQAMRVIFLVLLERIEVAVIYLNVKITSNSTWDYGSEQGK